METIPQADAASAPSKNQNLLYAVKKQVGGMPKILATIARSPAGRSGYPGVAGALAAGSLSNVNRKQIALAVAGANAGEYCASVHTGRGKGAGLSSDEMTRNLISKSSDPKSAALSGLAREVVRLSGQTTDAQLATLTTPVSIMRPVSRLSRTSQPAFSRTTSTISRGPKMISRADAFAERLVCLGDPDGPVRRPQRTGPTQSSIKFNPEEKPMTNPIEAAESASNALTAQGKILESIDQYYADNCVFIEPDGASRTSKAAERAHLEGFFASLKSFESATLHGQAVGDNFSASEWTFKMTAGDGSPIIWHETLVRTWQDGKIVSEKYYTQA